MSTEPSEAPQLEVRLARAGEEGVVARLIRAAFEPFRAEYTPGGFADTTAAPDLIRQRISEGARVWLALLGGEPAGTVTALPEPDRIYIRSMAVTPAVQGRGVGQALLDALEEDARDRGFRKMYLYTTFVLPGAQPLYEKNGFTVTRETAPEEWHDMGGVEMEKDLG